METFKDLGLDARLCDALANEGIEHPFPIQAATLRDALAGRDICAMAPTGSGKTLAFGLALLQRTQKATPRRPRALVLVPTRELAQQVAAAIMPFGKAAQRWVMAFYGGAGMDRQIQALRRGVDIAVATPGRLTDLVKRGECDLRDIETIVLDEADRMADMGFMPQVRWLLEDISPQRQVLLFSATLDGDVGELVQEYLHDPVRHEVAGQHVDGEEGVAQRAPQYRVLIRQDGKVATAAQLSGSARRALIFVKNRFSTERIAEQISFHGPSALYLHGGMSQYARTSTVKRWASGEATVLVATDIAARGLHVDHLDLVIHFDAPQDEKDFVHRSGRTARAGNRGVVVNLVRKEHLRATEKMEQRLGVEATTVELSAVLAELTEIAGNIAIEPVREAWAPGVNAEADRGEEERVGARHDRSRPDYSRGDSSRGYDARPRFERSNRDRAPYDRSPADRSRPDRPGFDRVGADRPRGERPFADRANFDRPRSERPSFGRSGFDRSERSGFDRPRPERTGSDRGWETPIDRPRRDDQSRSYGEGPAVGRSSSWVAREERPSRNDRPAPSWNDRPRSENDRPAPPWNDRPRSENDRPAPPWNDRPRSDRPASRTDRPGADWNERPRHFESRDRRPWDGAARSHSEARGADLEERDRPASGTSTDRPAGAQFPDGRPSRPSTHDRSRDDRDGARPIGSRSFETRSVSGAGRRGSFDGTIREEREPRAPRFDETGQPLNRRARRALEFGATAPLP